MRFNCAKPAHKGLAGRVRRRIELHRLLNWHPYFALGPVRCEDGSCRWLEWVARKAVMKGADCRSHFINGGEFYEDTILFMPLAECPELTDGIDL